MIEICFKNNIEYGEIRTMKIMNTKNPLKIGTSFRKIPTVSQPLLKMPPVTRSSLLFEVSIL